MTAFIVSFNLKLLFHCWDCTENCLLKDYGEEKIDIDKRVLMKMDQFSLLDDMQEKRVVTMFFVNM